MLKHLEDEVARILSCVGCTILVRILDGDVYRVLSRGEPLGDGESTKRLVFALDGLPRVRWGSVCTADSA